LVVQHNSWFHQSCSALVRVACVSKKRAGTHCWKRSTLLAVLLQRADLSGHRGNQIRVRRVFFPETALLAPFNGDLFIRWRYLSHEGRRNRGSPVYINPFGVVPVGNTPGVCGVFAPGKKG